MRLGVVGKGGVGKTTFAALLARGLARRGRRVVAIDTDSNPNLGLSLGLTLAEVDGMPVLPQRLVVGQRADISAAALIEEYGCATPAGPVLLSALRVEEAGAGCMCGGHATVRSFLGDALQEQADVSIVDMEAGLEHLSRSGGTLAAADVLLVVMEPSRKSVLTATRTHALASELGIPRVVGVGNKARSVQDRDFLLQATAEAGLTLAGVLPYDEAVADADRSGTGLAQAAPAAAEAEVGRVVAFVEDLLAQPQPATTR